MRSIQVISFIFSVRYFNVCVQSLLYSDWSHVKTGCRLFLILASLAYSTQSEDQPSTVPMVDHPHHILDQTIYCIGSAFQTINIYSFLYWEDHHGACISTHTFSSDHSIKLAKTFLAKVIKAIRRWSYSDCPIRVNMNEQISAESNELLNLTYKGLYLAKLRLKFRIE